MIQQHNIEMVRGDTLTFTIEADADIGTVSALAMTVRDLSDTQKFQVTLTSSTSGAITVVTSGRKWNVRVAPAATSTLTPGVYSYDIQMTIGSDIYTPLYGKLHLVQDVTR